MSTWLKVALGLGGSHVGNDSYYVTTNKYVDCGEVVDGGFMSIFKKLKISVITSFIPIMSNTPEFY